MNANKSSEREVLFQKLGNKWYIFAVIDGETVYSSLPEGMDPRETKLELFNVIEDHMKKVASQKNRRSIGPEQAA